MSFKNAALALAMVAAGALAPVALLATPMPPPAKPLNPTKPIPTNLYNGRWYEIARTPNMMQKDCQGSTSDFSGWASGVFSVVQTCHKGSPGGPKETHSAKGHIVPASANAKMKLGFLGGLITQEYWILDRSDDDAWAIMATPTGSYVWLLSRRPTLPGAERARALSRLQSLGFDLSRLAFPQQLAQ
jgi:apolipoprotein D and lipocalin family protein